MLFRSKLWTMAGDYPHTHALFSGAVKSSSVTLNLAKVPTPASAFARTVAMEFDVSELSLVTFLQAKTANEVLKAQERRLRLQKMKNEVVDRSRATALVFRLAREERDTWVNWPARIAALMAAELGVEAHPMQKVLETHVRAHLAELAELRPEFR